MAEDQPGGGKRGEAAVDQKCWRPAIAPATRPSAISAAVCGADGE